MSKFIFFWLSSIHLSFVVCLDYVDVEVSYVLEFEILSETSDVLQTQF